MIINANSSYAVGAKAALRPVFVNRRKLAAVNIETMAKQCFCPIEERAMRLAAEKNSN
jgi:hypothetical protein